VLLQVDEALEDKSVPISDKLRRLLAQFSVMRHEDKRDMLLPKGKSFYNQVRHCMCRTFFVSRAFACCAFLEYSVYIGTSPS
jgi:hypothetical protein